MAEFKCPIILALYAVCGGLCGFFGIALLASCMSIT